MNNRFFYASLGLLLDVDKNPGITNHFLSGVQSVGVNTNFQTVDNFSVGKTQPHSQYYYDNVNEINIERILSDEDVFWLELASDFLMNENRSNLNYQNTYFLKPEIYGTNISGWTTGNESSVKPYNIPEFDLRIVHSSDSENMLDVSEASGIISLPECLVSSIEYNLSTSGYFTENISLFNKIKERLGDNNFTIDNTPIENPNLLRRKNIYNDLCLYPYSLQLLSNFNEFFNGQEIFAITDINISLSLNHERLVDNGRFLEAGKTNWYMSLNIPIDVTCTFSITARKPENFSISNKLENLVEEYNILLEDTGIVLLESGGSLTLELGSNPDQNQNIAIVAGVKNKDDMFKFFIWNLGNKNRLTSLNRTGGSIDGSIVQYELVYSNKNNDFLTYTQIQASDSVLSPPLFNQNTESF